MDTENSTSKSERDKGEGEGEGEGETSAGSAVHPYRNTAAPYISFDRERCLQYICRMIIMHEYPLDIVEHPAFVAFVRDLQPQFDMGTFNTVQDDCVATFLREKQIIQKEIKAMPGRVCLTVDLWSSCRNVGYMFITGYYVDSEWKIQRKLLNIVMEAYPDSDSSFSHAVATCLSKWGMERKLFSLTINRTLSDVESDDMKDFISLKNPLIFNGQLLLETCLARTLSVIVQEALSYAQEAVEKVRDCVKYVKTSKSREQKFLELKYQVQVYSTKNLAIDDLRKWNTTYEMLLAASELEQVFSCLDTSDPDYKDGPSQADWKQVETLCTCLEPLFETASLLTTNTVPTANRFFHEAWNIQRELARGAESEDPSISGLAKFMQDEFDIYWQSSFLILAIAVVMDPRFKMQLVEFSFSRIYTEEDSANYVRKIDEGIHELFNEYVAPLLPDLSPASTEEENSGSGSGSVKLEEESEEENQLRCDEGHSSLTDFDLYMIEKTNNLPKSELDQYLEEPLLPRDHQFDVLGWWKVNRMKYPTLSKMARDILSIPVCTVPSESVFNTMNKEMDGYRCSLRPETVEALICAKDWLRNQPVDC